MWNVVVKRKMIRTIEALPEKIQDMFADLKTDLELDGPEQTAWSNYSKLGGDRYHCHLTYRYVACWKHENGTLTLEVYYVGSRENAPY